MYFKNKLSPNVFHMLQFFYITIQAEVMFSLIQSAVFRNLKIKTIKAEI